MNHSALPYPIVMQLYKLSPDICADLRHLETLVGYAWDHDTGGLIPYEMAPVLVRDPAALDRLNAVDLIHHWFDISCCGCHAPKSAWHYSIHDFRHLAMPARGPRVGIPAQYRDSTC